MTEPHRQFDLRDAARRAMAAEGFEPTFGPELRDELGMLRAVDSADPAIVDLRALEWSSIDNRESRDLDQVEVVEDLGEGRVRVLIGIADVDAYVQRGDGIDRYAAHNTTSVYTGALVFPMLPDVLSNDLTSLLEGGERLAIVSEFVVARDGSVSGESVFRARVVNRGKLAYEDVAAWLDGQGPPPERVAASKDLADQLRLQDDVARRLREVRIANGALQFETTEARPVTRDGEVVDIRVVEKSRSRDLIEALMVAANGVTARWLDQHGRAAIRRVVRTPKRWDRIVTLAAKFGATLPEVADAKALSVFLDQRRAADPSRIADLSLSIIKLLGPGEYALDRPGESQGHFGLAVPDYAHSTAPNRRFGDLVTQRIVKAVLAKRPAPYDDDAITAIAARCTEREHAAQKVERTTRKMAAALFMSSRIGESFDAIVTGATPKGTFARLIAPPAEGRIVELPRDGQASLDVGDRVRVRLVATEPSRGFIDFALA